MSSPNSLSINEIKKQLQQLGISISTPGLTGDDRLEELAFRLNNHTNKLIQNRVINADHVDTEGKTTNISSTLSHLSIGEIRSR